MKNEVKLTAKYFTEEEQTVGDEFTPLKSIATRKMLWRKIEQLRKENDELKELIKINDENFKNSFKEVSEQIIKLKAQQT